MSILNEEWLEEMSQAIVSVTKGFEKPDRKFAYHYLRTHAKLDALHKQAVRKFPGKVIQFGSGSLYPSIVVVTKDPILPEQKEKLRIAWKKLDVSEEDVYYAHLRFVKTKRKQDVRQRIFDQLIEILNPDIVIAFDGVEVDFDGELYAMKESAEILTDPEAKEPRKKLMRKLKQLFD